MDLACWLGEGAEWKFLPQWRVVVSLSQMRGKAARKEMEDGGRDWRKAEQEEKMGLFGKLPLFPITGCLPTKNLPPTFFRVIILICGQNSHQTLSRYQSAPRFQPGQDYQPDICSAVWRFEFNWWRWPVSDWPKIRCTSCVERIFWGGKKCEIGIFACHCAGKHNNQKISVSAEKFLFPLNNFQMRLLWYMANAPVHYIALHCIALHCSWFLTLQVHLFTQTLCTALNHIACTALNHIARQRK